MKISPALAKAIELTVRRHNAKCEDAASGATKANIAAYEKKTKPALDRLTKEHNKLTTRLLEIQAGIKQLGFEREHSCDNRVAYCLTSKHRKSLTATAVGRFNELDIHARIIAADEPTALKILADHGIIWK